MRTPSGIKTELEGLDVNVPLKEYTTFKIGGSAKYFFIAESKSGLVRAINWATKKNIPLFILGGGSNLLVSDSGFGGLVIKLESSNFELQGNKLYSEAGVELSDLVDFCKENSLAGLEWAVGIPGKLGGAVRGNISAFGSSIGDTVEEVEVAEMGKDEVSVKKFDKPECDFVHKNSVFKKNKNLIILSVLMKLEEASKKKLIEKMEYYSNYRKKTHPTDFPSAGCAFKNCEAKIKDQELLEEFPELREFSKRGVIPSSYLIDKTGLKGKRIGGAQISEKHANFIVNVGGAKASDVVQLINLVKKKVREKFGVEIKEEVKYLSDVDNDF